MIEGDTATLCGNDTLDSYLVPYDQSGSWITDDQNGGRGACSLIDGTGIAAPANGAAHNLPSRATAISTNGPVAWRGAWSRAAPPAWGPARAPRPSMSR